MLERMTDLPAGIDGVRATGKVSKHDYDAVIEPLVETANREGRRLRLLYEFASDFEGFTGGAVWEDAKFGLQNLRSFEGVALVTDIGWITHATRLSSVMMPCPVRVFALADRAEAVSWLGTLSQRATIEPRLISDTGVLVLEITHPLREADFDAVSAVADTWIGAHGGLNGLVLHARSFPGWENLGALARHVRFVRDHHRKVARIAVAVDGTLATLAPHVGEHFVESEVKVFGYDELEAAIGWAGGAKEKSE